LKIGKLGSENWGQIPIVLCSIRRPWSNSKGVGAPKMSDLKAPTYEDRDAGLLKTKERSGTLQNARVLDINSFKDENAKIWN
jgi:hypothetical protein